MPRHRSLHHRYGRGASGLPSIRVRSGRQPLPLIRRGCYSAELPQDNNRQARQEATDARAAARRGPSPDGCRPATHPLRGNELRALRQLQRESAGGPFLFVSERGAPFTTAGFAKMVQRAGEAAELDFKAHAHVLRHACGYGRRIRAATSGGIRTLSRARHATRTHDQMAKMEPAITRNVICIIFSED
jgi:hypothetical protein